MSNAQHLGLLTYVNLRADLQSWLIEISNTLQFTQMQQSDEMARLMQQQAQEEELVYAEFEASGDTSTENYQKLLMEQSKMQAEFDREMQVLAARNQAKEQELMTMQTQAETRLQAVNADIEGLEESVNKQIEEDHSYCTM